jgi:hypothetical protein
MADTCKYCNAAKLRPLVDFGPQPLTNRWPTSRSEVEYTYRLRMAACPECGVPQLVDPPPPEEIRSRYDWLSYNEPEGHLDDVVERIRKLPGITAASLISGTSYKEDTTFARLARHGFANTWRLDMGRHLGESNPAAGLETIQARFTPTVADRLVAEQGRADVVFARHIIEHAQSPREFAEALRRWVKPAGYVLFEVPDCTQCFDRLDYSMPWEEHVAYFTPAAYRSALAALGFDVLEIVDYPYSHENSLVAFCRATRDGGAVGARGGSASGAGIDSGLVERYAVEFPRVRGAWQAYLLRMRERGHRAALLGAGHLAATFINLLELGELLDCVVDDNPKKQGLFMPGSKLPIVGSAALVERGIKLCLLSVNPEVEAKVKAKNRAFTDQGGQWRSIFDGPPQA